MPWIPKRATLALTILVVVGLAACAGRSKAPLEQAEAEVDALRGNANVLAHAPRQLDEAEAALARTEAAWDDGAPGDQIEHLAYLTEQQAETARAIAAERAAQAEIGALGRTRQDVRLAAREAEIASLQKQLAEYHAEETDRGLVLTLPEAIFFDVDQADLKPGGKRELSRIAEVLEDFPDRVVMVEGHADSTGGSDYNLNLSVRRAAAVQNYLARHGVSPSRLIARGYGESLPVASNDTAAGRQQNRRVELVILDEGVRDLPLRTSSRFTAGGAG